MDDKNKKDIDGLNDVFDSADGALSESEILDLIGEIPEPTIKEEPKIEISSEFDDMMLSMDEIDDIITEVENDDEFPAIKEMEEKLNLDGISFDEMQSLLDSGSLDEALNPNSLSVDDRELSMDEIDSLIEDSSSDSELNLDANVDIDPDDFDFDFDFDFSNDLGMDIEELEGMELEFINDVSVYDNIERDDPFQELLKQTEVDVQKKARNGGEASATVDSIRGYDVETEAKVTQNIPSSVAGGLDEDGEPLSTQKLNMSLGSEGNRATLIMAAIIIILIAGVAAAGTFAMNRVNSKSIPNNQVLTEAPVAVQTGFSMDKANYVFLADAESEELIEEEPVETEPETELDLDDPEVAAEYEKKKAEEEAKKSKEIIEAPLSLLKFFTGDEKTIFYFNNKVNWADYDISLIDDDGKEYISEISVKDPENISKEVRFEALNTSSKGIVLNLNDKSTGKKMQFPVRFDKPLFTTPSVFLNTKSIMAKDDIAGIEMANAEFDFAETSINYMIRFDDGNYYDFDRITLDLGGSSKRISADETRYYTSDNTIVGNIKIPAVDDLNGIVGINFENINYVYENNTEINPRQLFAGRGEKEIRYSVGENEVVLERLGKMGPKFILVLHGEDSEGGTVETLVDAELNFITPEGENITLTGEGKSNKDGTDIVFDGSEYENLSMSNISNLKINNTKVSIGTKSTKTSLADANASRDLLSEQAIAESTKYFKDAGFEQVETVFYGRDGNDFSGVFKTLRDDNINDYHVKGNFSSGKWKLDVKKVEKEDLS